MLLLANDDLSVYVSVRVSSQCNHVSVRVSSQCNHVSVRVSSQCNHVSVRVSSQCNHGYWALCRCIVLRKTQTLARKHYLSYLAFRHSSLLPTIPAGMSLVDLEPSLLYSVLPLEGLQLLHGTLFHEYISATFQ